MCNYTIAKLSQSVISLVSLVLMIYATAIANDQCAIQYYVFPMSIYALLSVSLNVFFVIFSVLQYFSDSKVDNHKCLFWTQIIGRLCLIPIGAIVVLGSKFECKNNATIVPIVLTIDCFSQCFVVPFMWYMFNIYMQAYGENYYEDMDSRNRGFCCY